MSNPDRLYIEKKHRILLSKLKDENLLNINDSTNKEIFFWAMSLGLKSPLKLENREGFFLEKDLTTSDNAILYACYFSNRDNIQNIPEKSEVYCFAEECANRGFRIIIDFFESGSIETLDKRLLLDLNNQFEKLNT